MNRLQLQVPPSQISNSKLDCRTTLGLKDPPRNGGIYVNDDTVHGPYRAIKLRVAAQVLEHVMARAVKSPFQTTLDTWKATERFREDDRLAILDHTHSHTKYILLGHLPAILCPMKS